MKSLKFIEKIEINCTPEFAFDYTQDYDKRLDWDTFLKKADLIEGASEAQKGAKAYCVAQNGIGMETEYVSFIRPKVTAVKMTSHSLFFKAFSGSWTFNMLGDRITEVVFLYSFQLRLPFSLAGEFIKKILQSNVKQRLIDLKTNIELRTT